MENSNSVGMVSKELFERNISDSEIMEAGEEAFMIEDYPDDKYFPSSLLLGFSAAGRPLHIQVSRMDSNLVKIITIYQPDASKWKDGFTRRR